ncbi:hypothetical protein I4U23_020836 [Adineta vaga]|nr:hypothetical protein I4U23_020836 [Adineta vaga]
MEHIGDHLRVNHDLVLTVYCFVKKMSPAFDILLKCIYNICAENLNEICKRKEFTELDKELMIDIICQSTERRDAKHKEQVASNTQTLGLFDETEEEEEEEEE